VPTVSPRRYQRIVWAALVALATIVVTGAAVRLTESGLGCTDWPMCEEGQFAPEWSFHGWIEFGNRLFTGVVSATVIAAVLAARWRRPRRRDLQWLAWGLVAGVLAQIVLGGITVLVELHPAAVMGHFLLSMVLLFNVVVLAERAAHDTPLPRPRPPFTAHSRLLVVAATVVLVAGTIVTGTGPHGGDSRAERLPFDLSWVARIHGVLAWVLIAILVALAVRAARSGDQRLVSRTGWLLAAALTQGAIGYVQYVLQVPAGLVLVHILGSVVVWCGTIWLHLWVRRGPMLADWSDGHRPRQPVTAQEAAGQHHAVAG
jgi:heme a synthase